MNNMKENNYIGGTTSSAKQTSAAPKTKSVLDEWIDEGENYSVATKEAKQQYFLATDDLRCLPHESVGYLGFGTGPPMKVYSHRDLVEASLAKFGRRGITKKLEARRKREEKKRLKEGQAEVARKRLKTDGADVVAVASDTGEIKKLRGSLLKMAKKNLGFEMSGAPKNWRFDVPGTSKATFAALMNRPDDLDLDTFVKNGAYYTVEGHSASKLFGIKDEGQLTKYFSREMVGQKIGERVVVRYKPSVMEMSVSGYAHIGDDEGGYGGGRNDCVIS